MSATHLSCPSCHTVLGADSLQGREGQSCPGCGRKIRLPDSSSADPLRPPEPPGETQEVVLVEPFPGEETRGGWARSLWLHLRRAFTWDLSGLQLSVAEQAHFAVAGIDHPTLQRYLGWRRSVLFVASLPVALIVLLATIDTLSEDNHWLSGFGRIWLTLMILAPFALPVTVILADITWSNVRLSRRLLVHGWLLAFLVPLLLLLVPAHWLVDLNHPDAQVQAVGEIGARWIFGLLFFTSLCLYLPVFVVSMASGVQRACLRLKTLVPESPVPGLFLAASAPVLALVLFPIFVLVNQVASNGLLILGMLSLMAAPLIYLVWFHLFTQPLLRPEDFRKVRRSQWLSKGLFCLGVLLLLIYSLTCEWRVPRTGGDWTEFFSGMDRKTLLGFHEETSLFRPWSWRLIRWLAIEMLGRSLFTTVLVADLFMRVNKIVWSSGRQLATSTHVEHYDRLMHMLDRTAPRRGAGQSDNS